MSVRLYYFSGTGNSLFVAKELQRRLPGTELVPIVKALNNGWFATERDSIGFVFPSHGITIPIAVKAFIEKMDATKSTYFFAVVTRGGTIFRGFRLIQRALAKQEKRLNAAFAVTMATNDPKLESYHNLSDSEMETIKQNAIQKVSDIAYTVSRKDNVDYRMDDGIPFSQNRALNKFLEFLIPKMVHKFSPKVKDYFYANDRCIGCGSCARVCLSGKIAIEDHKPVWRQNITCYLCYSCLNYCPVSAIQIRSKIWMKSYTEKNGRYPHPYASVED
ncbi:MAG TPA: EFR1 family ferrodoxin, partial [Thermotogota bacterium]|nr:EFR1 family ferrodoxin [Thermotogota bacterium]